MECVPEFKWMCQDLKKIDSEPHLLYIQFFDANYRIITGILIFPGFQDLFALLETFLEDRGSDLPPPKAKKMPCTFIGSDSLFPHEG